MSETAVMTKEKLCPKCGTSLEEKAIACPKCGAQIAKAKAEKIILTMGQKIAAIAFIVNGLALIVEAFVIKDSTTAQTLKGALVSIVLGAYLFSGRASALKWAKFAAIAGGILYTGLYIYQNDIYSAVSQVLYSLSLVGLLFGTAGKARLVLCSLMILAYFGFEVAGLCITLNEPPAATTTQAAPQN